MTQADAQRDRDHQRLFDAVFIDEPTPEVLRQVDELLKSDEQFRKRYVQTLQLKADLEWNAVAPPPHFEESERLGARVAKAIHWQQHPGRFVSLAAALTLVFVTAFFTIVWPRLGEEEVAPQGPAEKIAPTVAQLVRVVDAEWEGEPPHPGEPLRKGRRLQLKSGMAQIRFNDGASVILEGPAVFATLTTNGGQLALGKLAARVETEKARGFTVVTPTARITDLGTEFGVSVSSRGTDVAVYQGEVRMEATDDDGRKKAVRLTAGATARVNRTGKLTTGAGGVERLAIVRDISEPDSPGSIEPHDGTPFVAYHDFGGEPSPGHITTQKSLGQTIRLIDYRAGFATGVVLRLSGANKIDRRTGGETAPPAKGTPGDKMFGGTGIDLDEGWINAGGTSGSGVAVFTLSGLNPASRYDVAFYGHRAFDADGAERFTLGGADSARNDSSTGIIDDFTTEMETRPNAKDGHIVRWTGLNPGEDGRITITIDPEISGDSNIAYLNSMRLEAVKQ